jgi:hypothetical protein
MTVNMATKELIGARMKSRGLEIKDFLGWMDITYPTFKRRMDSDAWTIADLRILSEKLDLPIEMLVSKSCELKYGT